MLDLYSPGNKALRKPASEWETNTYTLGIVFLDKYILKDKQGFCFFLAPDTTLDISSTCKVLGLSSTRNCRNPNDNRIVIMMKHASLAESSTVIPEAWTLWRSNNLQGERADILSVEPDKDPNYGPLLKSKQRMILTNWSNGVWIMTGCQNHRN